MSKHFCRFFIICLIIVVLIGTLVNVQAKTMTEKQKWTQFANKHIVLNFLSEDTPPTYALKEHLAEFEKLTGIKVRITQAKLEDISQKLILDFSAGAGDSQIFYSDPYVLTAPLFGHFADLRQFMNDPTLPKLPGGMKDFFQVCTVGGSYMIDKEKVLAIPYLNSSMILFYRKDIFEKYGPQFKKEKGYDWTPGPNLTWDQYYEISKWINDNVKDVKFGTGHQALMYDSLMCDFSNVLMAFGGKYFASPNVSTYGTNLPGKCLLDQPKAIEAAKFYKKLIKIAHPGSLSWDWNGVAEAFAAGEIALSPNWFEFSSMLADPKKSKVAGKVGYTILPRGAAGSANLWGGANISLNAYSKPEEQKAAWLFILWATSPEMQKKVIPLGATPTRLSVFNDPQIQKEMANKSSDMFASLAAVKEAWEPKNMALRPKIPQWLEADEAVYTELSNMIIDKKSPEEAMKDAAKRIDEITGWTKVKK